MNHAKKQGRSLRFVRTSHFAATREYFESVYMASHGKAQDFEKKTMQNTMRVCFFPRVDWVYDSNTAPYV